MAKNVIVLSVEPRETRAALIEDGIIAELHIERGGAAASTVGNVYLGKVTRVLPGLQAAFIDIGQERAAFLHVEDLIRPDDFDTYLAGGRKFAHGETNEGAAEAEAEPEGGDAAAAPAGEPAVAAAPGSSPRPASRPPSERETEDDVSALAESAPLLEDPPTSGVDLTESARDLGAEESTRDLDSADEGDGEDEQAREASGDLTDDDDRDEADEADDADDRDDDDDGDDEARADASHPDVGEASDPSLAADDEGDEGAAPVDDEFPDMPGFTITDPGDPVPRAASPAAAREGDRRGRRRGRRGRGRRDEGGTAGREGARGREGGGREGGRGGRGGREGGRGGRGGREGSRNDRGNVPGRISKSTPIREVVREGQEIIVQVSKDPIGTKGARCSSHISLPGRYVVYLPTVDHIGISKRIGSDKERARLREVIDSVKPPTGGLIVRTVAEGLTKKGLKQDVGYLVRLWGEIAKKREGARAPNLLMSELDIVLKVARDLFTDEVEKIVCDDKHQYERLCRFVEMFAPDRVKDVELYTEEEPIFDAYGIEDEIQRALSRKVPLPSGGYLIIDQAEALTAIDVNTGRFVGKGSKDMEETILKTNLEAVNEIAYQLRFRNIGGLIILDLIDMEKSSNREKVRRTLEELLQKDKAKTTLNRISDLGLIEMTRKRTRESLGRMLHEPCFYCDGTGQLQSKETIAYEILREIRRKKSDLPGYTIVVNAHPAVVDVLLGAEKSAVAETENRYMRKISVVPRKEYHLEQFDLQGK
ncbi:MAG: Rne/Rng family ribonuclease [Myxococcales bacterium]|nr:Rne/Rng family ribonuclease [Myxococcales bacterium]